MEFSERLHGRPIRGDGPGRRILLSLQKGIKRLGQAVGWQPVSWRFLFQGREPIGAGIGGWAVCPTSPVRAVPLSNRSVAERVSTPSGEVAVIGIS